MADSDSEYSEDYEESSREQSRLQNSRGRRPERKEESPEPTSYTETDEEWEDEDEDSDSSTKQNTASTYSKSGGNESSKRSEVKKFVPTVSTKTDSVSKHKATPQTWKTKLSMGSTPVSKG